MKNIIESWEKGKERDILVQFLDDLEIGQTLEYPGGPYKVVSKRRPEGMPVVDIVKIGGGVKASICINSDYT